MQILDSVTDNVYLYYVLINNMILPLSDSCTVTQVPLEYNNNHISSTHVPKLAIIIINNKIIEPHKTIMQSTCKRLHHSIISHKLYCSSTCVIENILLRKTYHHMTLPD